MSNKTRLQTNNTNIQSLIDKANSLPDAGSGGGSIDTCTVTITSNISNFRFLIGNQLIDGVIQPYTVNYEDQLLSITINNIVCGSPIAFQCIQPIVPGYTVSGGAEFIFVNSFAWCFMAPTTPNAVATITVRDDD